MENIIANRYRIDTQLAKGCFGIVFKGSSISSKEPVAIKLEISENQKSLKHETKILNYLYSNKVRKIPAIYWYGQYQEYPCLIMTYYEYSLATYIKNPKKSVDTSMANKIVSTIIDILSNIHKNFIIHRDIKPENFMIKNNEIFLIDFGLATFFISDGNQHLPNKSVETIIGTPRWISINIFNGNTYSRRDDLVSLGYIFAYLVLEKTPWESNIEDNLRQNENNILNINHPINIQRKNNRSIDIFKKLLENNPIVYNYLNFVYEYSYMDTPNYDMLTLYLE